MNPVVRSLPVLILYPHSRCNCRCVMCDIWKSAEQEELSADQLERHLDDIVQLRVEWVVLSGGEPLMHSDLFRLCCLLRSRGIRITVLSTGILLERNARRIVEDVDDLIVSLDGPPAVHDCIRRVNGAYSFLERGIRAILAENSRFAIGARCTVQRENHTYLRDTARTAHDLGLRSISFLAADVVSEAFNRAGGLRMDRQNSIALREEQIPALERELRWLYEDWRETGFLLENRDKLERIALHYRAHLGLDEPRAPRCNAPWVSAVIETNGTVRPCFFHPAIGSATGQPLLQVLNSPQAVQFRRTLDVATNPTCRRCVCSLNWSSQRPAPPQPSRACLDGKVLASDK